MKVKVQSRSGDKQDTQILHAVFFMSGFSSGREELLASLCRQLGSGESGLESPGKEFAELAAKAVKPGLPSGLSLRYESDASVVDKIASTIDLLSDQVGGAPGTVLYAISDQNKIFTRERTPEFNSTTTRTVLKQDSWRYCWDQWVECTVPEISGSVLGLTVQCSSIFLALDRADQKCSIVKLNLGTPDAQWTDVGELPNCKDICLSFDRRFCLKPDGNLLYVDESAVEQSVANWNQFDFMGKDEKERCNLVLDALLFRDKLNAGTHPCYSDHIAPSGCFESDLTRMKDALENTKRATIVTFKELLLRYFADWKIFQPKYAFKAARFYGKSKRLIQEWVVQDRTSFNIEDINPKNWSRGSAQTKIVALADINYEEVSAEDRFERTFHDKLLTGAQFMKLVPRKRTYKGDGYPNWPSDVGGIKHAKQYWKKLVGTRPVDYFGLFRLVHKECNPPGRESVDKGPSAAWTKVYNQVYPSIDGECSSNGKSEVQRKVYMAYFDTCEDVLKEVVTSNDEAWQLSLDTLYDEADEQPAELEKDPIKFLQRAQGHAEKLEDRFKKLAENPKLSDDDRSEYTTGRRRMNLIAANVCKAKRKLEALTGRTTTILGAQGTGKSTTLNNLLRMSQIPNVHYGRAKGAGAEAAEYFASSHTGDAPEVKMLSDKQLNDSATRQEHSHMLNDELKSEEPFVQYCAAGHRQGVHFKPFLLHTANTSAATTERAVSIRYGDTYHLLVEYYSKEEIHAEVAKNPNDKTIQDWLKRLGQPLVVSRQRGVDESDSEYADEGSDDGDEEEDSESDFADDEEEEDEDESQEEDDGMDDDDDLSEEVKAVLGKDYSFFSKEVHCVLKKSFIYRGYGQHVHVNVDRILCRNKIKELLHDDKAHAAVKKLTVFVPSQFLEGGHQWIDAPGASDEDALHRAQLTDALTTADHVLVMLRDKDLRRQDSDAMSIVKTMLFDRLLEGEVSMTMVLAGENQAPLAAWIVGAEKPTAETSDLKKDQYQAWDEKHKQLEDCINAIRDPAGLQPVTVRGKKRKETTEAKRQRLEIMQRGQLYQTFETHLNSLHADIRKAKVGLTADATERECKKAVAARIASTVQRVKVLRPRFFLYASLMTNIERTFDQDNPSLWKNDRKIWSTARNRSEGGKVIKELSTSLYSGTIQHLEEAKVAIENLFGEERIEGRVEMVQHIVTEAPALKDRAKACLLGSRQRSTSDGHSWSEVNIMFRTEVVDSSEFKAVENLMLLRDEIASADDASDAQGDSDSYSDSDSQTSRREYMKNTIQKEVMTEAEKIATKLREAKSVEIVEALKSSTKGGVTNITVDDGKGNEKKDKVATKTLQYAFMRSLQNLMDELTRKLHESVEKLRDLCRNVVQQQLDKVLQVDQNKDDLERTQSNTVLQPLLEKCMNKLWPVTQKENYKDHAKQTSALNGFMGGEASTWMMGDAWKPDGAVTMRKAVKERIELEVKTIFENGAKKNFKGVHVTTKKKKDMVKEFLIKVSKFIDIAFRRCVCGSNGQPISKCLVSAWKITRSLLVPGLKELAWSKSILIHAYEDFLRLIVKDPEPTEAAKKKQEAMEKLEDRLYSGEGSTYKLCGSLIEQYESLQNNKLSELEKLLVRRRLMDSMQVAPSLRPVPPARDDLKKLIRDDDEDTDEKSPFHAFVNNLGAPIDCAPQLLPTEVGSWGADHFFADEKQLERSGLQCLCLALLHATGYWKTQSSDAELPDQPEQEREANALLLRIIVNLDSSILNSADKKKFNHKYCKQAIGPDLDHAACVDALLAEHSTSTNAVAKRLRADAANDRQITRAAIVIQQFCNLHLCNVDVYVPTTGIKTGRVFHIACRVRTELVRYNSRAYRLAYFKTSSGQSTFSSVIVPDWVDVSLHGEGAKLRFNKTKRLGMGKAGAVYKGQFTKWHSQNSQDCAVKVVSGMPGSYAQREVETLKQLFNKSRFVIQYLEHYEDVEQERFYLAMELCDLSMEKWLVRNPTNQERLVVCRQLCEGLNSLHHAPFGNDEFIHRDLKPDNIMFKRTDGRPYEYQPKILDLSATRNTTDGVWHKTRDIGGSCGFLAPEQVNEVKVETQAIDVHTLGNVIYGIFNCTQTASGVTIHNLFDVSGQDTNNIIETNIQQGRRSPAFGELVTRLTQQPPAVGVAMDEYLARELHDLIRRMTEVDSDPTKRLPIKLVLQHPLFNWPGPSTKGWSSEGPRDRVSWIHNSRGDLTRQNMWLKTTNQAFTNVRLRKFDKLPYAPDEAQKGLAGNLSATGLLNCIRNSFEHPHIAEHSVLKLQPGKSHRVADRGDAVGRFFLSWFPDLFVSLFDDVLARSGATRARHNEDVNIWQLSKVTGSSAATDRSGGTRGGAASGHDKRKRSGASSGAGQRPPKGPRHDSKRAAGAEQTTGSLQRQRRKR
eukprot:COSAG02_NODE_1550_length_11965_cov_326.834401_2_plen_2401_part_00